MRRIQNWLWAVAVLVVGAALVAAFALPTGQYLITPGVTQNLNRIVHVSGGTTPKRGRILMVAVGVEPANWLQVLTARFRPADELLPSGSLMPAGMTFNQYVQLSMLEMQQSHADAQAAAFRAMGMKVTTLAPQVYIASVESGGPSAGRLEAMDRLLSLDGKPVTSAVGVVDQMHGIEPGTTVHLKVVRGSRTLTVSVVTRVSPLDNKSAFLGVELMQVAPYKFPRKVSIDTSNIGGPSAGMMMSLAIIAQTRPKAAFPGSHVVAGTGEITPTGQVEPIGGAGAKVLTAYDSGATVFLVPVANYASAKAVKDALHLPIRIIPVSTLSQALSAVGYNPAVASKAAS
jgi:Lon-like protease